MRPIRGKMFLCLLLLLSLLIASQTFAAEKTKLALISIYNNSGVDSIGGNKLSTTINQKFKEAIKKNTAIDFYDSDATEQMLKKAELDAYYIANNLCTDQDLAKIGKKIGVARLAILEINGYNEIKKEKSKKSYQLLLGLKIYNSSESTESYYSGEGLSDNDRSGAISNAVTQLLNNYLSPEAVDPNAGNLRANNASVIGNKTSRYYHLTEINHQPKPENQSLFSSRFEADKQGYQPCVICFPSYKSFASGDRSLEDTLGSEACGMVEYYYRTEDNHELINKLQEIATPIIKDTIRKNFDYKFRILDTDEVNAFAAPNGYIYVTKGLMGVVESDDELGFVIAHEIGHLEKKHAVIRYKQAMATAILASIFIIGANSNNNSSSNDKTTLTLFTLVMSEIIMKGYSREQEKEADEVALAHLKRTNMDYQTYQTLMGRFIDMRKRRIYSIEKIFSTHPTPEKRIEYLNNYLNAYDTLQTKLAAI